MLIDSLSTYIVQNIMCTNLETQYLTAAMLFGEALRTDVQDILEDPREQPGSLGAKAAYVTDRNLAARDIRYEVSPRQQRSQARALLSSGVDDTAKIIHPFLVAHNREHAYEVARHKDTAQTIAALALNNERRMHEIIAVNILHRVSFDSYAHGRGIMVSPSYFPDRGPGCPFAGKFRFDEGFEEPRPLFTRFCRWAIDLTLADLDKRGHFEGG